MSQEDQGIFHLTEPVAHLVNRLGEASLAFGGKTGLPANALDLHAGTGALLARSAAPRRIAVEHEEKSVEIGRELYPDIEFHCEDPRTFTSSERFDTVISLLPLGARIQHEGRGVRFDALLFERALTFLNEGGVAVLVTPPTFATASLYEPLRRRALDGFALDAIVDLPRGSLGGFGIDLRAWVLRKGTPRTTTFLGEFTGDVERLVADFQNGTGDFHVPRERLRNRLDRNFHDPKYHVLEEQLAESQHRGIPVKPLRDIVEIVRGYSFNNEALAQPGEVLLLNTSNLRDGRIHSQSNPRRVAPPTVPREKERFERALASAGDVVVALSGYEQLKWAVVQQSDLPAVARHHIAILRSGSGPVGYITAFLKTAQGRELFNAQVDRKSVGRTIRHLSIADLGAIRIPILPIADLESLSDDRLDAASESELRRLRREVEHAYSLLAERESELEKTRQELAVRGGIADEMQIVVRQELQLQTEFIGERLDRIDGSLAQIQDAVEAIREQLAEIKRIKESPRTEDDRLAQICSELNTLSAHLLHGRRSLDRYEATVRSWLHDFDRLDAVSRQFLPIAELLFDELARFDGADFSPFIIQYSRALENEILQKLFCAYHDDLAARGIDRRAFVAPEINDDDLKIFAKAIRNDNRKYTLGTMNRILQMLKAEGRTLARSAILQDFRVFTLRYFEDEVVSASFLDGVGEINDDFRNKAAHPYVLSLELAQACQTKIREILCDWLEAYPRTELSS